MFNSRNKKNVVEIVIFFLNKPSISVSVQNIFKIQSININMNTKKEKN